jgi:hypothetical protein
MFVCSAVSVQQLLYRSMVSPIMLVGSLLLSGGNLIAQGLPKATLPKFLLQTWHAKFDRLYSVRPGSGS